MEQLQAQIEALIAQVQAWPVWEQPFWDFQILELTLRDWAGAALGIAFAYLLARLVIYALYRFTSSTQDNPEDDFGFQLVRTPLLLVITLLGVAFAFEALPLLGFAQMWLQRLMLALVAGMTLWLVLRFYFGFIRRNANQFRVTLIIRLIFLVYWLGVSYTLSLLWITWPISCVPNCVAVSLTNTNLSNLDLRNIDLTQADLTNSDLGGANLTDASLAGANLTNVNLQNAQLDGADFAGTTLTNADLRGASVRRANFRGANLTGATMTEMDLRGVVLSGTIMDDATMVRVNLSNSNLSGTELLRVDLTSATMQNTRLLGVRLSGSDLSGADLTGANLSGSFVNLADLSNVQLADSQLLGTNFIGSNLSSADLTNSEMEGAVLIGANMSGADLSGANLIGARLFPSEFSTVLYLLDPELAALNSTERAQVLSRVMLSGVIFDDTTIWPPQKAVLLRDRLGQEAEGGRSFNIVDDADTGEEAVDTFQIELLDVAGLRGNINLATTPELASIAQALQEEFIAEGFAGQITLTQDTAEVAFDALCVQNSVDVVLAQRRITEAEAAICAENDHELVAMRVGTVDTLVVVVNPLNTVIDRLNVDLALLRNLLLFQSWSDISSEFAIAPIRRLLPEPGTSEYNFLVETVFDGDDTQLLNTRNTIFEADESNILWDLTDEQFGIAIIGYDYFRQNDTFIKGVPLLNVPPNDDGIEGNVYPLVRPLMMYTNSDTLRTRYHVTAFLINSLESISDFLPDLGFVPLRQSSIDAQEQLLLLALGATQN